VRISALATPSGVDIVVADHGPGIPAADRERATERFFRGEIARSSPGSGLGLALVQAVAQLHGGSLHLEDAQPGVVAILSLPGHDEPASHG
jgi:signal transduction histidine kinase